jgi:uncharacterized protein YndB with AHSA1/START domain
MSIVTITTLIPAPCAQVYHAWLDSAEHAAMTGGAAQVNADIGVDFYAWDRYIKGRNLELEQDRRILQSWRTAEFAPEEADSLLEITLEPAGAETRLTLRHSNLPAHGTKYQQGWVEPTSSPCRCTLQLTG